MDERRQRREERRRRKEAELAQAEETQPPEPEPTTPPPPPSEEEAKRLRRERRRQRKAAEQAQASSPSPQPPQPAPSFPAPPEPHSQWDEEILPDDEDLVEALPEQIRAPTVPGPSAPQSYWAVEGQAGGDFRKVASDSKHAKAIITEREKSLHTPKTPKPASGSPDDPIKPEIDDWAASEDAWAADNIIEDPYRRFSEAMSGFLYAVFLFCQGLLGGFSLLHVFVTFMPDDQAFLRYYSALAAMTFLILLTLSSAGAFVVVADSRAASAAGPSRADIIQSGGLAPAAARLRQLLIVDVVACILYFVALLFSVINAPIDDRISRLHNVNPTWYQSGVPGDINLSLWHVDNGFRWALSMMAWLLVAYRSRPRPPTQAFLGMGDGSAGKVPPTGKKMRVGISAA